jgi:hypothetical protein
LFEDNYLLDIKKSLIMTTIDDDLYKLNHSLQQLYESHQATQQQVSSILTIAIATLPVVLLNNQTNPTNHKGSIIGRRIFKRNSTRLMS